MYSDITFPDTFGDTLSVTFGDTFGRIVKYLCLGVKIAKSENEKFSVVYSMQFSSESFDL